MIEDPNRLNRLADQHRKQGRLEDAERVGREGLAMRRRLDPEGLLVGNDLMFLSQVLEARGELGEALVLAREARAIYARAMGADHGEVRHIDAAIARLGKLRIVP